MSSSYQKINAPNFGVIFLKHLIALGFGGDSTPADHQFNVSR
jgi:hypothetical protein